MTATSSARLARMSRRVIRRFGDRQTITLRERCSLLNQITGAPLTALAAVGAHSAGAATLTLDATGLVGTLVKGAKLTIAATVYTVGAAVEAASGALTGVSISPVLAAPLADNGAVSVSQPYADYSYSVLRAAIVERELADGRTDTARSYRLAAVDQTREPKSGDVVVDGSVVAGTVVVSSLPPPPASAITAITRPITRAATRPIATFCPPLIPPSSS